jgi:hypothetical protein
MNDGVNKFQVCGALLFLRCALAPHTLDGHKNLSAGSCTNRLISHAKKTWLTVKNRREVITSIPKVFPRDYELFLNWSQKESSEDMWAIQNVLRFWMRYGMNLGDNVHVDLRCETLRVKEIVYLPVGEYYLKQFTMVDPSGTDLRKRIFINPFVINLLPGNVGLVRCCVVCHIIPQSTYTFAGGATGDAEKH